MPRDKSFDECLLLLHPTVLPIQAWLVHLSWTPRSVGSCFAVKTPPDAMPDFLNDVVKTPSATPAQRLDVPSLQSGRVHVIWILYWFSRPKSTPWVKRRPLAFRIHGKSRRICWKYVPRNYKKLRRKTPGPWIHSFHSDSMQSRELAKIEYSLGS
jgi:hypothetical protein